MRDLATTQTNRDFAGEHAAQRLAAYIEKLEAEREWLAGMLYGELGMASEYALDLEHEPAAYPDEIAGWVALAREAVTKDE